MKKRRWFLSIGIVLGMLTVGLSFADYNYVMQKKSPWKSLTLKNSSSGQLTARMWDDMVKAIEDIDLRLKAVEGKAPVPSESPECGSTPTKCVKGKLSRDNKRTSCGTTRIWKCKLGNGVETQCTHENEACPTSKNCPGSSTYKDDAKFPKTIFELWGATLLNGEKRTLTAEPTSIEGHGTKPRYSISVRCNNGTLMSRSSGTISCPSWTTYSDTLKSCGRSCTYHDPDDDYFTKKWILRWRINGTRTNQTDWGYRLQAWKGLGLHGRDDGSTNQNSEFQTELTGGEWGGDHLRWEEGTCPAWSKKVRKCNTDNGSVLCEYENQQTANDVKISHWGSYGYREFQGASCSDEPSTKVGRGLPPQKTCDNGCFEWDDLCRLSQYQVKPVGPVDPERPHWREAVRQQWK